MGGIASRRTGPHVGLAVAVAAAFVAACTVDREDVMFQKGDFVFDFLVDASLAGGTPGGSSAIDAFDVAAVDTTPADAFDRSIDGNRSFYSSTASRFGGGFNLQAFVRNGSTDPRLPALADADAVVTPAGGDDTGLVILDPSGLCSTPCALHNIFTDGVIENLKPSTRYVVALVRYAIEVRGALDAAQTITGAPIAQPDSLVLLGGTPKGDPTVRIESFPTIVPFQTDANPYVLGFFETDASGAGGFDVIVDGTGVLYADNSGNPPDAAFDSSLVARNDDTPTTFPRYNYLVVFEGSPTTAAEVPGLPQVLRAQIGQDFVPAGGMGNNAYAPYPDGPFTAEELLATPCCAGRPSALTFTFRNLGELAGAVYQVWLYNAETGEVFSPAGDWTATDVDTAGNPVVVGSATGVRTFNSKGSWTHTFVTDDGRAGQPVGLFTHVFLSVEASEASVPSASQPLWAQFTDMAGAPDDPFQWSFIVNAPLSFGTFGLGESRVWVRGGLGRAGFWGEEPGVTDRLVVRYRNLPLPPRGYYYEGWLVDEAGNSVPAGELTAPFEEGFVSLRDVDGDPTISARVRPDVILEAVTRVFRDELPAGFEFPDFVEYRLTLSPKARSAERPPTTALGALTPDPIRSRAGSGSP